MKSTPYHALAIAGVITLLAVVISANIVRHQPWLGVDLVAAKQGLLVESVGSTGPSAGILYIGDVVLAIGSVYGDMYSVKSSDLIEDPDMFHRFEQFDTFLSRQRELFTILVQPTIRVLLNDGRIVRIQPQAQRPLFSLPWSFWFSHLFSTTVLLISMAIWNMQREMVATKLLLLSGAGLFVGAVFSSIYISRELALDMNVFFALSELNSIGVRTFCIAGLALLWYYPRTLAPWSYLLPLLATGEAILVANEIARWWEPPFHAFYFDYLLLVSLACAFGIWRWQKARGHPVERAIIKWFTLPIFLSAGLVMLVFILPVFYFGEPVLSVNSSYMILLIMYFGLVLGVIRFRLFDIEHWWISIWGWFLAGVTVIAFDIMLVTVIQFSPTYSLAISMFIVGWVYFPVRQWLLQKIFHAPRRMTEDYVPLLIAHFIRLDKGDDLVFWHQILHEMYKPLSLEIKSGLLPSSKLLDDGKCLLVPSLSTDKKVELRHADGGRRLFDREDVKCSQTLFNIAKRTLSLHRVYTQGVSEERKRIMRDLHDDIGGRLLTLVHASHSESQIAAEALKRLREIIYSLDIEQNMTVNTAAARWRIEALERCEMANINFTWNWHELNQDIELSPRYSLNLTLIFREALTNVFRHAKGGVVFDLSIDKGKLKVFIRNDTIDECMNQKKTGKGLHNMQDRTKELGGEFDYTCEAGIFCIQVTVPLVEVNHA